MVAAKKEKLGININKGICDALSDLVPFVHPWWSVNFSKVAG